MSDGGLLIETSVLLAAIEESPVGEATLGFLQGAAERDGHISELVLSEVYNLNEPRREWTARLLADLSLPVVRISTKAVNLAQRYVYNKVLEAPLRDLGLHVALASVGTWKEVGTWDRRLVKAREGIERINKTAGYPIPVLSIPSPLWMWGPDEELDGVRALSWRVTEKKKDYELMRIIQEMAANFIREKGLTLEKVGKVELF